MAKLIEDIIKQYKLEPLSEEGGFFRFISTFGANAGSIYFLITKKDFSHLHVLTDDELWFFLEGDEVEQLTLTPDGEIKKEILDSTHRHTIVKAGDYQASYLKNEKLGYALVTTVMAPRYNDAMYTHAPRELEQKYPELKGLI